MAVYFNRLLAVNNRLGKYYRSDEYHLSKKIFYLNYDWTILRYIAYCRPFSERPQLSPHGGLLCEHIQRAALALLSTGCMKIHWMNWYPELEGYKLPVFTAGLYSWIPYTCLHQLPDKVPGQEILKGVYWGGDFEVVVDMIIRMATPISAVSAFTWVIPAGAKVSWTRRWMKKPGFTIKAKQQTGISYWSLKNLERLIKNVGGDYEMMVNFPDWPKLN